MSTTSLKLPDDVKRLATAAAKDRGVTPHAFMVEAIRTAAVAARLRAGFVADADAARTEAMASGKAFPASEVHAYLRARVRGVRVAKPKAKSWRR
jgi:predicted transcriptional regulator